MKRTNLTKRYGYPSKNMADFLETLEGIIYSECLKASWRGAGVDLILVPNKQSVPASYKGTVSYINAFKLHLLDAHAFHVEQYLNQEDVGEWKFRFGQIDVCGGPITHEIK